MHAAALYLARAVASLSARAEVARPHIAAASSDGACLRVKADAAEAEAPMSSMSWPRSVSEPSAADCARRLRCTASMSTISCEEHAPSAVQSTKPSDLASAQSDARSRAASPPASSVVVPCKLSAARAISANVSPRSSSSSSSVSADTAATATDRRAKQMAAAASATSSW
eukprot:scaffold52888_cov70-Phaeocystis_antarctica.AAC.19